MLELLRRLWRKAPPPPAPTAREVAIGRFLDGIGAKADAALATHHGTAPPNSLPAARVEETCVGPKLFVHGVLVHWWLGTMHDEAVHEMARAINAAAEGTARVSLEPVPDRVYWAPLADNFYSAEGRGMGLEFYRKWKPRRTEFPQGESYGWGKGSAHNPFKDPPRAAVAGTEGSSKQRADMVALLCDPRFTMTGGSVFALEIVAALGAEGRKA